MKLPFCAGLQRNSATTLEFEGVVYPDGRASDPASIRWMEGAPPPVDKRIAFDGDPWGFPQIRWTMSHIRELFPTVGVRRRSGPIVQLNDPTSTDAAAIESLRFTDMSGRACDWEQALEDTYTDGILVIHRGRVVYERYCGALERRVPHLCMSMTKSYAATLAATLVSEGILDVRKTTAHYVPQLNGSAWGDATLREVMDMLTSVACSEHDNHEYGIAGGWRPRPGGYDGPGNTYDYLCTVAKEGSHGEAFSYKSVNTDVLGWVMARVTGRSFPQLLEERLWAPLGCEEDGYVTVDSAGFPIACGGLCATLRDLARFGELMRREGDWEGRQLIPASVVQDVQRGGDRVKFAKSNSVLPGSYRSMWWITHNELDAYEALGVYGQRLYVAPKAEMVIARFASRPIQYSASNDSISLAHFLAIGRMLRA